MIMNNEEKKEFIKLLTELSTIINEDPIKKEKAKNCFSKVYDLALDMVLSENDHNNVTR